MKQLYKILAIAAVGACVSQPVNAALATFTDRAAWLTAAGRPATVITFNSITADILLDPDSGGSAVDAGPFSVSEIGSQAVDTRIDASPFLSPFSGASSVNGTTFLYADLQAAGNTRVVELVYDEPIAAWGADVKADFASLDVIYNFQGAGQVANPTPVSAQFFGVVSTEVFSRVTITGSFASIARFDDISSAPPIPLPPAVWLLGSSLVALGAVARRRRMTG